MEKEPDRLFPCTSPSFVYRYTLRGEHGNDIFYTYEVGICVDVGHNCAVLQKGETLNTDVCVGSANSSQVARSELEVADCSSLYTAHLMCCVLGAEYIYCGIAPL